MEDPTPKQTPREWVVRGLKTRLFEGPKSIELEPVGREAYLPVPQELLGFQAYPALKDMSQPIRRSQAGGMSVPR